MIGMHEPKAIQAVEVPQSPLLQRLLGYWDAKRGRRGFPSRADIDPIEFSFALNRISMVDVLYNPLRFKYRVWGSEHVRYCGVDMTGKYVDEYPVPEHRDILDKSYRDVVERRSPAVRYRKLTLDGTPRSAAIASRQGRQPYRYASDRPELRRRLGSFRAIDAHY
jgi:hypothetical protein